MLEVQFNGKANGIQNLSRAVCKRFGLDHSRALKHAKTLEVRGLIIRTYSAKYTAARSRIPSQWALGWRDVTHTNNRERGIILKAPDKWQQWTASIILSGRFDQLSAITAVVLTNLLRIWAKSSAFDRYTGYAFGNHVAAGLPRHGHSLRWKIYTPFEYTRFYSEVET